MRFVRFALLIAAGLLATQIVVSLIDYRIAYLEAHHAQQ